MSTSNDIGLWLGTGAGDLTLAVREGDPAFTSAGGARFEPWTPLLNNRGDLLVWGRLFSFNTQVGNALWLRDNRSGQWTRLLETGDTILGQGVGQFRVTAFGGSGTPLVSLSGTPSPWSGGPGYASGMNDDAVVIVQINPGPNETFEAISRIDLVPPVPCPADLDGNGTVGAFDLALLLGNWGPCDGDCPWDLDDSCDVGAFDLALLLGNWGDCP